MVSAVFLSLLLGIAKADTTIDVNGRNVILKLFDPGGIGNMGTLALLAFIAQMIFVVLIVLWVFIAIFAGIKIIRSQGSPDEIQGGTKRIKNILAGITIAFVFFLAISFLGAMAGIGSIFEWADNLQECSCENATSGTKCYTYLFQAKAADESKTWTCNEGFGFQ